MRSGRRSTRCWPRVGLAQGPQVAAFEQEFAAVVGGRECVAVNSGTSALHMALIALGIGAGDEVIVPSFTFAATANAVALAGATPVFVDIEPDSFCISPEAIEAAITPRTRAVMPVHLYGHPAAMDRIAADRSGSRPPGRRGRRPGPRRLAARHPGGCARRRRVLQLLPDEEHDLRRGRAWSQRPSPETARMVRLLRNQGMEVRYRNEVVGFNTRMTDIHAAIGRVQLGKLAGWTARRQANAAFLTANLEGVVTSERRRGRGARLPPVHDPGPRA